jgi:uncharacterized membrane protein YfcA
VLYLSIFLVALLYSSVGQAGASGYIAVFTLFNFAPESIKPTVLILNALVAIIGTYQFGKAGHFSWRLFLPFTVLAVPFAFLGGYITAPANILRILVGGILILSAIRLLLHRTDTAIITGPRLVVSLPVGAAIGFLSGITATGGGIFLTPILLFFRWARTKTAAAVSVVFILVNSIAALGGYLMRKQPIPENAASFAVVAIAGGAFGSYLGSRHLPETFTRISVAGVLTFAGIKLLMG